MDKALEDLSDLLTEFAKKFKKLRNDCKELEISLKYDQSCKAANYRSITINVSQNCSQLSSKAGWHNT